jgi:hypothetical protein
MVILLAYLSEKVVSIAVIEEALGTSWSTTRSQRWDFEPTVGSNYWRSEAGNN